MSDGDITIREARREEYDVVGELVVGAYRTLGDAGDDSYESILRDVAFRAGTSRVLVAEVDRTVLGTVTYDAPGGDLAEVPDPGAATIRMLGVAPAARGRGIGEALVRSCIAQATVDAAERIRLDTRTSMTSAQRLYERLGFERAPEHDWSPVPGIDLLAYVLAAPGDASSRPPANQ